ncbi:MAG: TolC family protein [Gemmatimonadaceae bacterium]
MKSQHDTARETRGAIWRARRCFAIAVVMLSMAHLLPAQVAPQDRADTSSSAIAGLIARAQYVSPRLRAARSRADAVKARVRPAGLRPDPMVMVGVQNFPLTTPGFSEEMTMKMVGVSQTFPLWGKLAVARNAAVLDVETANAQIAATSLEIARDVRLAVYDIAYVDRALEIVDRNRLVLIDLIRAAEIRFAVGVGPSASTTMAGSAPAAIPPPGAMPGSPTSTGAGMGSAPSMTSGSRAGMSGGLDDIMSARLDATRLADQAAALREDRRTAVARLNATLDRPTETPVAPITIPVSLERAAVEATPSAVRFESALLGSRASGSPIAPVDSLQRIALLTSPELRTRTAMIAAQSARVELALRGRRPDVDASIQYGQRDRMPDMVTAQISFPWLLRRRDRQDQYIAESRADLAALEADRHESVNRVNAEIARLHSAVERSRTQLALYKSATLPQAQLGIDAALVSFSTGSGSLRNVLDAQIAVFNSEIGYHRALADFAKAIAELEQMIGAEIIHD